MGGERRRGGEAVEAGGAGGLPSSRNFLWISTARSITWRRTEFWRRTGAGDVPERRERRAGQGVEVLELRARGRDWLVPLWRGHRRARREARAPWPRRDDV